MVQNLSGHHETDPSAKQLLADLAAWAPEDVAPDSYGAGDLVRSFEAELADVLGKPAAVFMPSGIMAQQCALRVWADRTGCRRVALHPRSHLVQDELGAISALGGIETLEVGPRDRVFGVSDLPDAPGPLSSVVIELPQRRLGGQLPKWEALQELHDWAEARSVPMHLDGARLWESQPFYGRSLAEICERFASVYVSFYKGLGGFAGAMLAGPYDFIDAARVWQRRHGGTIFQLFPMVLSSRKGWETRRERFAGYHARAVEIAATLGLVDGVRLEPAQPHTNAMCVHLSFSPKAVQTAADSMAADHGVRMFPWLRKGPTPTSAMFELTVGDATMALPGDRIVALLRELTERARAAGAD
jgi:threonine aldolase